MRKAEDLLWIWLLPDLPRETDREEWKRHGGKWIVFDRKDRIVTLASRLAPFIDSGQITSAKYWKKDPSAICVYSLDRDRDKVLDILTGSGAAARRVWEYDYAMDRNMTHPVTFLYSWYSKFGTILRSYGIRGALQLLREVLKSDRR